MEEKPDIYGNRKQILLESKLDKLRSESRQRDVEENARKYEEIAKRNCYVKKPKL